MTDRTITELDIRRARLILALSRRLNRLPPQGVIELAKLEIPRKK